MNQTQPVKFGQPFSVPAIGFIAGESLGKVRVSQSESKKIFHKVEDRNSVFARAFHHDNVAVAIKKPTHRHLNTINHGGERFNLSFINTIFFCRNDSDRHKVFVDINTGTDRVNYFQRESPPLEQYIGLDRASLKKKM